ncbi:MAG: CBS domain-containing protein [SAR324 cluster bacterium]|jgi:signal-transduction protein with cAMP-binding, CBS, and nucleotidyltransferase domain|nr:CBS domain-containing protein [SAR324 cluster bacterium]
MLKTETNHQTKKILSEGQVRLSEILDGKRSKVVEVDHQASVALAVERMCFHKVGAVVVVNQSEPVGLFTERDLMHRVVNQNKDPVATPIRSVMTTPYAVGSPGMSVIEAAELMSDNRIRHLPVYDEGIMIGMVSSGDILAFKLSENERSIKYLEDYFFSQ